MQIHNDNFKERQEAKIEYYQEKAKKNHAKASEEFEQSRKMADRIPFGQPILIGHHSEKSDRNYRNKIDNKMRKSIETSNKADYYDDKVKAAQNNHAIRTDDPEAVRLLKEKLTILELKAEKIKEHNKKCKDFVFLRTYGFREGYKTICNDNGTGEYAKIVDGVLSFTKKKFPKGVKENIETYFKTGAFVQEAIPEDKKVYDSYHLSNLSSEVRRIKKRIEDIQKLEAMPDIDEEVNKIRIYTDEGRIKVEFGYKPSEESRAKLKRSGFRWSPYNQVWQSYIKQHNLDRAREIANLEAAI